MWIHVQKAWMDISQGLTILINDTRMQTRQQYATTQNGQTNCPMVLKSQKPSSKDHHINDRILPYHKSVIDRPFDLDPINNQ